MASTTPLRPLELPPFTLHPLLSPVFSSSSQTALGSLPSTPTKPLPSTPASPPPSNRSRLGQLVSNVTSSPGSTAPESPSRTGTGTKGSAVANVRSVDAADDVVWVGGSDGRVRRYTVGDDFSLGLPAPAPTSPVPGSAGRRTPTSPTRQEIAALDLTEENYVTASNKSVDRIAILSRLDKAVILSEGVLTFHALHDLSPMNVHAFPALRGVTSFSLDEHELAGNGSPESMQLCAFKRRTLHVIRVTFDGCTVVRELPLRGGALISTFRRGHVCIADHENYSIVDLQQAIALPLLPISQAPNMDDGPASASGANSSAGPDPRQRPAVACVGHNEFLIASHTANTTLGVFVTEAGEPCRGTLEWANNLRSLVVDSLYAIALLHNNTIEIHSLATQLITQSIQLPTNSSPLGLQPRQLAHSHAGIHLGAATGANKLETVTVPLLPLAENSAASPFSTPLKNRRSSLAASNRSHRTSQKRAKGKGTLTKILLVGKNNLYALTPLTLIVQADALIEKGRIEEALSLTNEIEKAEKSVNPAKEAEFCYVYLQAGFLALASTKFQQAFQYFERAEIDPRALIRLFPDLATRLINSNDTIEIFSGLETDFYQFNSISEIILSDLNRNYSPHILPNVETAESTLELKQSLEHTARQSLRQYLIDWRIKRRQAEDSTQTTDSRKIDTLVDTVLVKLLAEAGMKEEISNLFSGPNFCLVPEIEENLLEAGMFSIYTTLQLKRGGLRKTLNVWTKLVEGVYSDAEFEDGLTKIYNLLRTTTDNQIVEEYGIWLIQRDRDLGLKLFSDASQGLQFDTRSLFAKMRAVDATAADLFLESAVLSERDADSTLHSDLLQRYIHALNHELQKEEIKIHARQLEQDFREKLGDSMSPNQNFLSFLVNKFSPNSATISFDRIRLKTILILVTSNKFNLSETKQEFDEFELKGFKGFSFERTIIYGKLRLDRQALSLLVNTLDDLDSAELFCTQLGNPCHSSDLTEIGKLLNLPIQPKQRKISAKKETESGVRKVSLARMLVEICLAKINSSAATERVDPPERIVKILQAQAIHLDPVAILPSLPADWPLNLVEPYFSSCLRRSLHSNQQSSLLKSLALAQNLQVTEHLGDLELKLGPRIQTEAEGISIVPDLQTEAVKLEGKESEKGFAVNSGDPIDLDLK